MKRAWKVPKGLGKYGSKLYRDLGPELMRSGSLRRVDRPAFELLCQCYSQMREAFDKMHAVGLIIKDERKSIKKNPLFQIWKDSFSNYMRLSQQFGLTPQSRDEKMRFSKDKEVKDENFFAE